MDEPGTLHISPAIGMLTAPESLELGSKQISFSRGTRLPASITQLHLCDDKSTEMPQQASWLAVGRQIETAVTQGGACALKCTSSAEQTALASCPCPQVVELPQLARLAIHRCKYSAASLAPLSRLSGSLARLSLRDVCDAPTALTSLTRLRHLHCERTWEVGNAFQDSLQHFPQLTCLVSPGGFGLAAVLCCLQGAAHATEVSCYYLTACSCWSEAHLPICQMYCRCCAAKT